MARTPEQQIAHGEYLATMLTDLEFETLVRKRIRNLYDAIPKEFAETLHDGYNVVSFSYSPTGSEPANWSARIGSGYNKYSDMKGEVLSKTHEACIIGYNLQHNNKMSLLLGNSSGQTSVSDTGDGT